MNITDETNMLPKTDAYLYLSGTPLELLQLVNLLKSKYLTGHISDEQRSKENWKEDNNPYLSLPRMVLMTYQLPDSISEVAKTG